MRAVNLAVVEDIAWLGALIVGDGSIYVAARKAAGGRKILCPMVSVIMCDRFAIQRAAGLIRVKLTASGRTPITGRRLWRAQAIGARALKVIALVRPFLTETRIKQVGRAIKKARASGVETREERKQKHKLRILTLVKLESELSTKRLQKYTGLDIAYARRYLNELLKEGKIRNEPFRVGSQLRNRWLHVANGESQTPEIPGETQASGRKELMKSSVATWAGRNPLPSGRGYEPRLGSPTDRAWLGGLMVSEGTAVAFKPKGSSHFIPRIAIRMLDKGAIERAAALMAVACVRAGRSKESGRQFWQANAVGDRAIRILEIIKPYLTQPKLSQAQDAIVKSRESGFTTIREMQAARKEMTMRHVLKNPGSLTTEVVHGARVCSKNARKYLTELEHEGKIRRVVGGTLHKPNTRWYPA